MVHLPGWIPRNRLDPRLDTWGVGRMPELNLVAGQRTAMRCSGIRLHRGVNFTMNRYLLFSLIATAAAWLLVRNLQPADRTVPVSEAAVKLQQAWADHHATA
jgi:hypothetical protein